MSSLDQKDYEGAVATLAKIQQSVENDEQRSAVAIIRAHVRDKLTEASATDPKATEALNAVRMLTIGR